MNAYADDADCGRCGKPVHLLHDPPCEHGYAACPECGHAAVCRDCHHIAELETEVAANPWPPHDLDNPVTPTQARARQAARLHQAEADRTQAKRTYDEAQARYTAWTQQRGQS